MFSVFKNCSYKKPYGIITLGGLYDQLRNPSVAPFDQTTQMIINLRGISDEVMQKKAKSLLPAFSPGAVLYSRDSKLSLKQKIEKYSGFIQIDIDIKDNPLMSDPGFIRDWLIINVPYIALSAISARGGGVWALFALKNPEQFSQYPTAVYEYFQKAGISIDKSKSKSPTELRYFAPDPGAAFNPDYRLFPLPQKAIPSQHTKPSLTKKPKQQGDTITRSISWVENVKGFSMKEGQRHMYFFYLTIALRTNGIPEQEIMTTIRQLYPKEKIRSNCISGGIVSYNKQYKKP